MFSSEVKYYDLFHQDKDYGTEAKQIRRLFPRAKTILEIGCGTGNLTHQLEKLGFDVLGIDNSEEMLEKFKGKKAKCLSIQDFQTKKTFDLVLAMYDVLNYIPHTQILSVMQKIARLGKASHIEVWPNRPVKFFTIKKAHNCTRLRFGFRFHDKAYLWYIFWGQGLVISHHQLYV